MDMDVFVYCTNLACDIRYIKIVNTLQFPACFGKKYTFLGEYIVPILKPAINGEIIFKKFHNL
jgi:hypothetical protein